MFTSTPQELRKELNAALGYKADGYWNTLNEYLSGRISRVEYDELIREAVDNPQLVQLHNSLIISVLASSSHHRPPTPPPSDSGKAKQTRKRRRTLPYQGEDETDMDSLRSPRLKRWTVGIGRKERERVQSLVNDGAESINESERRRPRKEFDEIAQERGVVLVPEGRDPPGTYLPVHLASVTRAPTLQHINERIALISAQHNLSPPSKSVASLLMLACEAKLKQLITQTIALTATSHAVTSIQVSGGGSRPSLLSATSFDTLFTLRPAVLPNQSAAAMRLALGENIDYDQEVPFKERHIEDPRWQLLAMLAERSTVREALLAAR